MVAPGRLGVDAPGGVCVVALRGMHGHSRGACMVAPRGGMHGCSCGVHGCSGGHTWDMTRYGDTVNEQVVRILLECILV